jgi:uncharacterized protein YdbL (DUF1318 family)
MLQAKRWLLLLLIAPTLAFAQADLEINTPAISAVTASLEKRHPQLAPFYASGAIGYTGDGNVAVRDVKLIPLPQRQAVNQAVAAENADRGKLYKEIAVANNHPEWEADVRATFAQRWVAKAPGGWYYQDSSGSWVKK